MACIIIGMAHLDGIPSVFHGNLMVLSYWTNSTNEETEAQRRLRLAQGPIAMQ